MPKRNTKHPHVDFSTIRGSGKDEYYGKNLCPPISNMLCFTESLRQAISSYEKFATVRGPQEGVRWWRGLVDAVVEALLHDRDVGGRFPSYVTFLQFYLSVALP